MKQLFFSCQEIFESLTKAISVEELVRRVEEIDSLIAAADISFWNNNQKASAVMKERQSLSSKIETLSSFKEQLQFISEYMEVSADDPSLLQQLQGLYQKLTDYEFKLLLDNPIDINDAILTISAGAGGLESANFVNMLLRMYCRYADAQGFQMEILDQEFSKEHSAICIDQVSISVKGRYAYGFLKGESGVHRLIRHSPFSSADLVHTSFAAVYVVPDIEDVIEVKIEDKDLEITAQRAGGPGGQHQNKTSSAIRLRHIPTGINILARTERDQHANKRIALRMLKAKLYDLEIQKRKEEQEQTANNLSDISFGSQIRTYRFSPNSLVKDHRTECEMPNVENVLDGDIQNFVDAFLRSLK